ncbi:hypothetical protein [Yinghuangia seranimata]|uniref:hypothetical protein n=1 Tax=Yinghuangia seranimata TaxID=408067 RepID=UPI00248BF524|nr:hypothetical protein [Yinghuangia seranimata]MDI2124912.1 hypothetical protein [Yinghuangia seranimata]
MKRLFQLIAPQLYSRWTQGRSVAQNPGREVRRRVENQVANQVGQRVRRRLPWVR